MAEEKWTGGCQCGAVRYELSVAPDNPCLCHCRICQKQVANAFDGEVAHLQHVGDRVQLGHVGTRALAALDQALVAVRIDGSHARGAGQLVPAV